MCRIKARQLNTQYLGTSIRVEPLAIIIFGAADLGFETARPTLCGAGEAEQIVGATRPPPTAIAVTGRGTDQLDYEKLQYSKPPRDNDAGAIKAEWTGMQTLCASSESLPGYWDSPNGIASDF